MAKVKVKVPKKIAGVKVPKKLRKEAKQALKLADSQAVRDLAIAGLTLAAEKMMSRSRRQTDAAVEAAADLNLKALHLGDVLRAAAVEGARQFLEGFEQSKASDAPPKAAAAKAAARPAPKRAATRTPKEAAAKAAIEAARPTPPRPARKKAAPKKAP